MNQQYEAQKGLANAQEVYNQALEKAETAQTEMNKAIEEGTNHAPDYAAAVDYANAEVEDAEKVVKEYEKTLDDLDSQYDSTITFIENYTKGNDTASKSIFNLGEVSEDATAAMAESLTELRKKI